jgi:uncharacterized protein YciI
MAYAIAIIRYRRSLEEMQPHVEAHRAYVRQLQEQGTVIAGGPIEPRFGGAILFRVPEDDPHTALDRIRDADPYIVAGVAQYEILVWNPIIGSIEG